MGAKLSSFSAGGVLVHFIADTCNTEMHLCTWRAYTHVEPNFLMVFQIGVGLCVMRAKRDTSWGENECRFESRHMWQVP